jgi:predicted thioesterase
MKNPFKPGDIKIYEKIVQLDETATFDSGQVHPFYATFALGRDAEWAGRLFVLEMKEEHEEGIGTFLHIEHRSPALIGETVHIESVLEEVKGNKVICSYKAFAGERLLAEGRTGQKIIDKNRFNRIIENLNEQREKA